MHAAQGMEHRSGAGWLDTIDPRSTSTFCEVADEGTESEEAERSGSRTSEVSPDISGNPSTTSSRAARSHAWRR